MFSLSGATKFKYIPNYKDMRGGYDKLRTFFTHGGLAEFEPESFDKFFGDCIWLPEPIQ